METRLAMDLGGTKLLVGEVDEAGRVLAHREYPSRGLDQVGGLELMRSALEDYTGTSPATTPVR